uniref:Yippee domain-containing protein n=1 Tax=Alexandrium catenella TaxID=2925 RepID=A0A7S1RWE4_ALECA|mmetsp:Transcript_76227/g.202423  ORF Transcript_76227/g.202423 Transcript_76227/m.202423 type:complete len:319 (+) Transcript_76227:109-1065(+)|eukprot:CAMPEP_0171201550 /NCGR_PEP_ID=MMETSP0790-20130122/24548_1 /TAXON_ID=2925 /ORGANISM="Alexandrium catenella, Strain OF101" /LENGTH=318 /DNA_ID=CAMNT_0011666953 /DNA_START=100 /DNA_END=1056 /DNA_ORIENTATION=-
MVFGRLLRSAVPQAEREERFHDSKRLKEDHGWEDCNERLTPSKEDKTLPEPAPSTQEPEEAISDTDWDWDMPGASRSDDPVGALVVDDYLLVGESVPRKSGTPQEHDASVSEESTALFSILPPTPNSGPAVKESSSSRQESTPGCNAMSGVPAPAGDILAATKASTEVSAEEPPVDPHTADGAAGPAAEAAQAGLTAASPDEEGKKDADKPDYRCLVCNNHIFKEEDILSSNYHAMTGPGYLTSMATNVCIALELQTQLYTTGKYTVREVSCSNCAAMLGVTYAGAADVRNRYKVGKFLIGRDRLRLPPGVVHPMDQK